MKTRTLISTIALFFTIALITGCTQCSKTSPTAESDMVRQLKLEKTQIANELKTTKVNLLAKISELEKEIATQKTLIEKMKTTEQGYTEILMQTVTDFEELKIQHSDLAEKYNTLKKQLEPSDEVKSEKTVNIEQLKAIQQLQKKAAESAK